MKPNQAQNILLILFLLVYNLLTAQVNNSNTGIPDLNYTMNANFEPVVKDAVRQSDLPEINDTIKRIENISYSIVSVPITEKYEVSPISAAKMINEPLSKVYRSLLKLGFGNYTMPYGEFFLNNLRSKDNVFGLRLKHLSSQAKLDQVGFSGFNDSEAGIYTKHFFKKHTLQGDVNYFRNALHQYGYPDSLTKLQDYKVDYTRQLFSTIDAKFKLISHYTDSNHINHTAQLNYYNFSDIHHTTEDNVFADVLLKTKVNGEFLNIYASSDYYHVQAKTGGTDDYIFKLNPYFEAKGKRWKANVGVSVALDKLGSNEVQFYFYPQLNVFYNVYNHIIIPYAGISGGLEKNSFRGLSTQNPYINPGISYQNTNNAYQAFGGIRGTISSNISYDTKADYGRYVDMPFFILSYDNFLNNTYTVVYDDVDLLHVSGQLKYQFKEKINVLAKGNYYSYNTADLREAFHKPNMDVSLGFIYNLQSKIILKTDVFYIGPQIANMRVLNSGLYVDENVTLKGIADINLGVEYRYSKMLSFFIQLNNLANSRYYRWDRYPTQRFNGMIGLTFVPF